MRKTLIYILTAAMALSITACGNKETETQAPETTVAVETEAEETEEETEESTEEVTEESTEEESSEAETDAVVEPETEESKEAADNASGDSVAYTLLADFQAQIQANGNVSAQEIADTLLTNSVIQFMGGSVPVEQGLLSGFGNAEITGFEEGVMFAPMIGSIPFVGYVFDLADGTDAAAFVETLESNADLRWNICVEADEMVSGVSGDKVFFVMSPLSFEE